MRESWRRNAQECKENTLSIQTVHGRYSFFQQLRFYLAATNRSKSSNRRLPGSSDPYPVTWNYTAALAVIDSI